MKNAYKPEKARIKRVIDVTPTMKSFVLRKTLKFVPGQFVQVSIPAIGEAPFSISSSPHEKNIMITVNKVGDLTKKMHELKANDNIWIRGPYGNGFNLEKMKGSSVNVVSGGCGFAPVRALMLSILKHKKDFGKLNFIYGARTPEQVACKREVREWKGVNTYLTVDRKTGAWKGSVGMVTKLVTKERVDPSGFAVVVGPEVMMKFAVNELRKTGFRDEKIFLSLERLMYCGQGMCEHCRVGKYLVCEHGPVFSYEQIKNAFKVEVEG